METFERLSIGSLLRVAQALAEASPTLVFGLLIAGVFRRMLGERNVLKLFGGNTWRSMPLAWLMGMLLPICSLGVFPVVREMRRSGVQGGALIAFALAAPLFNPLSFLYGLTLSRPIVIFAFALLSLAIVTLVGLIWDWLCPEEPKEIEPSVSPPFGLKRMAAVAVTSCREACGPTLLYIAIALAGVALLAAILPANYLQGTMKRSEPTSPLLMAAVATPAYHSPIQAIMKLSLMFEHGNSVGAAFTLLILGAGANLGVFAWAWHTFGPRQALTFVISLVVVCLAFAYACSAPLADDTPEDSHTHAFDDLCNPFYTESAEPYWRAFNAKFAQTTEYHERVSLWVLGGMLLVGALLNLCDRQRQIDAFLERQPEANDQPVAWFNRSIPSSTLALLSLAGLVLFSILSCYIYYPPAGEVFAEMSMVQANAIVAARTGSNAYAIRELSRWDDLSRRMEVGVFLREGRLDPKKRQLAESFRESAEELRDALLEARPEDAQKLIPEVTHNYQVFREAYRKGMRDE